MRKPSGELLGFATVIRDTTEKQRAEESLRQARDELELRVRDRTAELAVANKALQAEVLERKQAQEVLLKQSDVLPIDPRQHRRCHHRRRGRGQAADLQSRGARNSSGSRPIR